MINETGTPTVGKPAGSLTPAESNMSTPQSHRVVISLCFILALHFGLSASVSATSPDPLASSLEQADSLFDEGKYAVAQKLLEDLLKTHPTNAGVLWRLANHMINNGDGSNDDAKEQLYRKAIAYAERAIKADPRNPYGHAYLAAAHGSIGMFVGGKEKVKLANLIRDELDEALRLDPRNQVANTIYGTWHREVATVGWIERQLANMFLGSMPDGSLEKSIFHLKTAIAEGPNVLRHHYELGRTYIAADREKEAAASFRTALKCQDSWKIDYRRREKMREFLAERSRGRE